MSIFAKALVALVAASTMALAPVAAQVATFGIGDKTNAVRYGASDPLGECITKFTGADDTSITVEAPVAMNFFGTKYDHLCISINGGVIPTNDLSTTCASYDKDVAELTGAAEAPMVAVLSLDIDLSEFDTTLWDDDDASGDLNEGELNDDGFALPRSIYWGTTTVDGRDAVVVTWYRVPNNDNGNDRLMSNTFQLLLIKLDGGNATDGYDFDFELNYATLMDHEDGNSVEEDGTDIGSECAAYDDGGTKSATYDLCRWGAGVGNYTGAEGGTGGYEFFDQFDIGQLIDSGDTAMIEHSLGSSALGRYRCGIINGQASGCDFSADLAEKGFDANNCGLIAAALIAAGGIAVAVRRRKA